MALIDLGFQLQVVLSDQGGNRATLRYDLTAADYTAAALARTSVLAALVAVTDAVVMAHYLREVFQEDGVIFGTGEIENIASISARIDSSEIKYATVRIPAPIDGVFQAASGPLYNLVDPADVALLAYMDLFETGQQCLLSDGESLEDPAVAGNITGKRIHRKSRKG